MLFLIGMIFIFSGAVTFAVSFVCILSTEYYAAAYVMLPLGAVIFLVGVVLVVVSKVT